MALFGSSQLDENKEEKLNYFGHINVIYRQMDGNGHVKC